MGLKQNHRLMSYEQFNALNMILKPPNKSLYMNYVLDLDLAADLHVLRQ